MDVGFTSPSTGTPCTSITTTSISSIETGGPAFIKVCGYAPYAVKVCLNAHEWAKRQAQRRGIPCEALDNGFLACADPASLQAICDSLSADDIQDFFDRWVGSLPLPLTADDAAAGFSYRLSIL